MDTLDCLVIGGGPCGLVAATYLARYRRKIAVIDAGKSRAALIPKSHNFPAFPLGISGNDILKRLKEQAQRYGVAIEPAEVTDLKKTTVFLARTANKSFAARTVILATGLVDGQPDLKDFADLVRKGLIKHCPICDAYEVIDQNIAVLGDSLHAVQECFFLLDYTSKLTLYMMHAASAQEETTREKISLLQGAGVEVSYDRIDCIEPGPGSRMTITHSGGSSCTYDCIYSALGERPRGALAEMLGARLNDGCVVVDTEQCTSLQGLYAVGDVTKGLSQMSVGMGQAALAATAIHNALRAH